MKLGTETASVINNIYSRAVIGEPAPKVGMGATILGWTDRYAATITKVTEFGGSASWKFEIEVVDDLAKVVAGSAFDGSAEYEYSPGDGPARTFRKSKKTGMWVAGYVSDETGKWNSYKEGKGLRIGERDAYRDPSF
jgi:hypothetical protein